MLSIKKVERGDISIVSEMEREIFKFPWEYESFEELLNNRYIHFYIVYKDKNPCGYFGIMMIIDECDIYNLAVRPKYQKMGIGNFIMENIINICKENKINTITLEVREFNNKAISLYEKYGFKLISRIKGYYSKHVEDGLLMRLNIDEK